MQQVRNVNAHFSNLPQNKNIGEKKKYQVRCPTKKRNSGCGLDGARLLFLFKQNSFI